MLGMPRFREIPRQTVLGFKVPVATTFVTRLLGLSFLDIREAGQGLLIPGCRRVHTFGMRFPLDLLFLDSEGRVIDQRRVAPRRFASCAEAFAVLELPAD